METIISPAFKNLNKIERSLERVATRVIVENAETILNILKYNQLSKGLDSKEKIVGTYESYTQYIAYQERQASGGRSPRKDKTRGMPYNFEWTGQLFDGLNLKANSQKAEYSIFHPKGKLKLLESIYKTKLGDLTPRNNEYINMEIIYPKLIEYILEEFPKGL